MDRRSWLLNMLSVAAGLATVSDARAQEQPVRILTGFAPGGSADALARVVATQLQGQLGRTVIVENKPGAAGRLAVDMAKEAKPDGTTLLLVPQGPMTLFPHVFKALRYDPVKDFTPISRIATGDFALSAGPLVPAQNVAELRAWLKTAGDKASFGSPGAGTIPHFLGAAIGKQLGVTLTHIPYKGAAPALTDVAGGTLALAVSPITEALPLVKGGRIRVLATTGERRSQFLNGVPTLKESGLDVDVPLWYGLYAPAGVTGPMADKLRAATVAGMRAKDIDDRMKVLGLVAAPSTVPELMELQRREFEMWAPIVKTSGFTPED
jgi:tripartite-type tricarboxylate transporter receptor subunit TctC